MQRVEIQKNDDKWKKGQKRRADILNAAMNILAHDGYGELTMRRIAKDTGISLGHLQYHFPNKKSIIHKLLKEYLDQAMQKIQERSSCKENSPEDQLETALNVSFAEQHSKEACQIIYELWALSTRDREAAEALKSFYEQYCTIVAGFLQHMNPSLCKETVQKRSALIVAMLEGLSLYHLWENSTLPSMTDLEGEFKQVVKSFMLSS
ncbi:MAG: hypothetical protein C0403_06830 [Desulfobacterium sp.]|nr:hypothetical protein [Desulfobacterium sp.]